MHRPFLHQLYFSTSLIALAALLHHSDAFAGVINLNSSSAISSGTNATITGGTNPSYNSGNGTATSPTFTTTGIHNYIVTVGGTIAATGNNDGITITGNNTHGFADVTNDFRLTGSVTGSGFGAGLLYETSGQFNFITIQNGASVTSGTSLGLLGALTFSDSQALSVTNHGTITGRGGQSAIQSYIDNQGDFSLTSDGTITAAGSGSTVNIGSAFGGYAASINITGGTVTQTGTASTIVFSNQTGGTGDSVTISGGTVSNTSSTAPVIDVSGTTSGAASTVSISGGAITSGGGNSGVAVQLGRAGDTLSVSGGAITGAIQTTTSGNGAVTFNASSGFTTNGDIGGGTTGNSLSSVTVSGGALTLNNNVKANAITLSGGTTTLGNSVTANTSTLNFNGGNLNLGTNTLNTGNTTFAASTTSSIIHATLGASANGKIVSSGTITNSIPSGSVAFNLTASGHTLHHNDEFVLITGTTSTSGLSIQNSNWTLTSGTSGTDAYGNTISGNNIIGIYTGGGSVHTETNRGLIDGAISAVTYALNSIASRLDSIRGTQPDTRPDNASAFWVQGFGGDQSQGRRDATDGYRASTAGYSIGADKLFVDDLRLGAAFTYAATHIGDTGASTGNTANINSYFGTLYSSYNLQPVYIDNALDFGYHHYGAMRLTDTDSVTNGHNGYQYTLRSTVGLPIAVDPVTITPIAGLRFTHLEQNGYFETGAANAALSVSSQAVNSFKSTIGTKVYSSFTAGAVNFVPEASLAWEHEFISNAVQTNYSYLDGSSSFTTRSVHPEANAALIGLGLTAKATESLSLTARYDAEIRAHYVGNAGLLQARFKF